MPQSYFLVILSGSLPYLLFIHSRFIFHSSAFVQLAIHDLITDLRIKELANNVATEDMSSVGINLGGPIIFDCVHEEMCC